jgi:hypothetical protein
MRRAILVLLAFAVVAPAETASAQMLPPVAALVRAYADVDDPTNPRIGIHRRSVVAAYGEGATTCQIGAVMNFTASVGRHFSGWTECSADIQQSGVASWSGAGVPTVTGPLCSAFGKHCTSSGDASDSYTDIRYRVTLRAPAGQGWSVPPGLECSGAGTDYLQCTL